MTNSNQRTSHASESVFVDVDDFGRTAYVHRPCGQMWFERAGDESPNYCPNCGELLFDDGTEPRGDDAQ